MCCGNSLSCFNSAFISYDIKGCAGRVFLKFSLHTWIETSKSSQSNQVSYWNYKIQQVIPTLTPLLNWWIHLSTQIFLYVYTPKHKSSGLHTISAHEITILHSKPDRIHSNPASVNAAQHRNQKVAMQVKPVSLFTLCRYHCGHTTHLLLFCCSWFDIRKTPPLKFLLWPEFKE